MPRNPSGNYTLPGGNPVVGGTTILASWANTTLSDLAAEVTDSLDRSGKGGMLAPLALVDGAVGAPALAFASETTTGLYRAGSGDLRATVLGSTRLRLSADVSIISTLAAGSGATDFILTSSTTRTAGNLLQAQNNGVAKFSVNYAGDILVGQGTGTAFIAQVHSGQAVNSTLFLNGFRNAADTGNDVVVNSAAATRTAGWILKVQNNGTDKAGFDFSGSLGFYQSSTVYVGGANGGLTLLGNKDAADAGTDVVVNSSATRTAGALFLIKNNGSNRLYVTGAGDLALTGSGVITAADTANLALALRGNKNAADTGTDVVVNSTATRTAGNLLDVQNNGSSRLSVQFDSTVRLGGAVPAVLATASNTPLYVQGNRNAADSGADVIAFSTATRTAGLLFDVQNNGASRFTVDYLGGIVVGAGGDNTVSTGIVSSAKTANSSLNLYGFRNAADAGTDVVVNAAAATRTAGTLLDVRNNSVSKADVGFNGVISAPNVPKVSEVTSDDAVTGTTMQSVTGLSFPVAANADYEAEFFLLANTSATAIHRVQFTGPAAPTKVAMGSQGIFGTTVSGFGAAAFSTAFQIQPANITTEASVIVKVHLRNGANAGTVQLQHNTDTAGQTATIFAGSHVRWQRVDNAGKP